MTVNRTNPIDEPLRDRRPFHQRFDLNYVKHRSAPWRQLRVAGGVFFLAAGACLAAMSVMGERRIYSSGEMTHAHAMFGHDCAACHQPDPQRGKGYWLPVRDEACLGCHSAEAHHPDRTQSQFVGMMMHLSDRSGAASMARQCSSCHLEHRGPDHDLNRVPDRFCTQCHADLSQSAVATKLQGKGLLAGLVEPPIDAASSRRVTSFSSDHPQFAVLTGGRFDATPIDFQHRVHMDPDASGMQEDMAAWVREGGQADGAVKPGMPVRQIVGEGGAVKLQLSCTACHQYDAAGRYMQPIRYESHCAHCHPLGALDGRAIPHGSAIRPFLDELALQRVLNPPKAPEAAPPTNPATPRPGPARPGPARPGPAAPTPAPEDAAPAPAPAPNRPGPNRPGPAAATTTQPAEPAKPAESAQPGLPTPTQYDDLAKLKDAVAQQLAHLLEGPDEARLWQDACGRCHNKKLTPLQITSPNIPDRWMPRSHFSHQAHRFMSCVDCHGQAVAAAATAIADNDASFELRWTDRTREIMMPSIDLCRRCHASRPVRTAGGTLGQPARHDCVMCHSFHAPALPPHEGGVAATPADARPRRITDFVAETDR